jgi:hypothetical protein
MEGSGMGSNGDWEWWKRWQAAERLAYSRGQLFSGLAESITHCLDPPLPPNPIPVQGREAQRQQIKDAAAKLDAVESEYKAALEKLINARHEYTDLMVSMPLELVMERETDGK